MNGTIIILHGWGITGNKYHEVQHLLEKKGYQVFAPDMPGFGKEKLGKKVMNVDDYVKFVHEFLQEKKIKKAILLGHSFGGRVAAKFSAKYPGLVEKLILTGAPLIKKPLPPHKQLISTLVKNGKVFIPHPFESFMKKGIYKLLGEWDYYKAGSLKKTLQNVLAEDISPILSQISVPTLLIWGNDDTFVPVTIGREISQRIQKAFFVNIPGATHKLPYENSSVFTKEIVKFLS